MRLSWLHASSCARILFVTALGLTLVSCRSDGAADPTPLPSVTSGTTAGEQPPVGFRPVVWTTGIDAETGKPVDRVETFPRDTVTIYAALEATNLPAGGTLTATWEINDRPVDNLVATIEVAEDRPRGWVEFHLDWGGQTMWPVGTLTIRVSSDTGQTIESAVEIE